LWFTQNSFLFSLNIPTFLQISPNFSKISAKNGYRQITERGPQIISEYKEKFSASLVIKELHIKISKHYIYPDSATAGLLTACLSNGQKGTGAKVKHPIINQNLTIAI
jgi:hypothetical protein